MNPGAHLFLSSLCLVTLVANTQSCYSSSLTKILESIHAIHILASGKSLIRKIQWCYFVYPYCLSHQEQFLFNTGNRVISVLKSNQMREPILKTPELIQKIHPKILFL